MPNRIITDEFLKKYKGKQPPWGYAGLGYVVYKRTYSRLKEDNTYEEWHETVARCINGSQEIGADYTKEEAERLFDYMFNLKCNMAGRMLWQLGTSHIKRYGGNSLLNCWSVKMNEPEAFCFLFENLMLGGGVGFSVSREDVYQLPNVKEGVKVAHINTKDADFIVPDSREGWVSLLRRLLKCFFITGRSFTYSTILVRGYGERIKGFGGTASGPGILVEGIDKIVKIFQNRETKKLRSIDVLDICNIIASVVVSGNVRRSASIAIGDPDDYLFVRAKRWDLGNIPNWRALSNNTIYADDYSHITNDIWEGYSGNGEPYGLFNVKLAQTVGRAGEHKKDTGDLCNPCFTGDTKVETLYGQIPISELVGKETLVYCYDGKKINISKMKNIRKTGTNKPVYKIVLDNGKTIKSTDNHKFMLRDGSYKEVKDLKEGDSLMPFKRFKRNSKGYKEIALNDGTHQAEAHFVAEWRYGRKIKKGECVHHIDKNKVNNSPENLEIVDFSKHNSEHMRGDNNPARRMPHRNPTILYPGIMANEKNPRWDSRIKIEDVVSLKKQGASIAKIADKLNTTKTIVRKRLELASLNNHKVKSIKFCGYEDVYDGEVEKYHNFALEAGVIVHNCAEIILANYECCNLSEVYLNNIESKEELKDVVKLLYKTQKAVCNLPFIHEETNKIVHKNMRIGVGMTGICQSLEKLEWLDEAYKDLKHFDKEWSKKKDYYESIRLSTVKPSGTLSLLAGATPGVHPAYSQYYIRRVRMASDDKMVKVCKDLGYHTEYVKNFDGTENHNTTIVEFPCYSGDNVIVAKDMSAVKQLELVKKMQEIWSDNSVSVTVYYKKEELPEIKKWLKENYKNSLKTVSFLLHQEHGFKQAPYEEITKEKYKELMKNIKPIKYSKIDGGTDLDVEECAGGVCPIK